MEADEGEGKKSPDGGEKRPKRKMKTAYQLELLEKTYAVSTYPSEALRAELSVKLGLSDRQLQMWFCHRRLKDRKASELAASVSGSPTLAEPRKAVARMASTALARIEADVPSMKRYYEPIHPPLPPAQTMLLRAIAFVESQLGEPIREDGPILGVEFDPLPPGAFGAPIETSAQQKQMGRPYDGKLFERHDAKSIKTSSYLPSGEHCFLPSSCGHTGGKRKASVTSAHIVHSQGGGSRALHEYQFLPEQPSVRSEPYERITSSHFYDSPVDNISNRVSPLATGGSYLHGSEQGPSYAFQGQTSSSGLLSQHGRQHIYPPGSTEYEIIPHKSPFSNTSSDALFGSHQIVGIENPYLLSDRRITREEDATRIERKRKSEEARIAKEVEAHEKRIRRELEKQDILRRKREEQMRREMERHDRERRKEEERLMREKQREEERFQREQRREIERREKFLQKENRRAEKMRRKEELRREKEAARIKAAHERATARRIAREYMELVEDERLELMELAASNKGLPSIIFLDSDTLQDLDMFRDMLTTFPPKSIQLQFKRPFAVQPWTDSEENIGHLLMVWRFLITFADVLDLWPFTLDEFVQAFHDYDPRLLGEIHIALLRSIIKDIEDVARTPAVAVGANQNSAANPGGGHPQIVEGAYAWGFDIRSWQRHLDPLTWPEILRQFALSAGFGPQLKKRNVERAYLRDENEGHDGEDIISTLRNGSAAENAVALMKERGFSRLRRSRHRLTPGTVKFAAFHVLSLEGSRGLTILEVADKIQKSGLRDLTTSKTPEASIAAALSRDSKLFERTAPSTYCVKSQFRKDPADADAVLAAAREKIKVFENGFSDSEEAEKDAEDADEAERDDDSESDGADDLEVDDVGSEEKLTKEDLLVNKIKISKTSNRLDNGEGLAIGAEVGMTSRTGFRNLDKGHSSPLQGLKGRSISGTPNNQSFLPTSDNHEASNADQEDTEIDESNSGEPWVQGLMEGEYSELSVEERLNALVALVGVAIEGNSIRVVLEERLEAANALKKQMWAEAQLDKRRMKEEYMTKLQYSSFVGMRSEAVQNNVIGEGSHSPLLNVDNKSNDASLYSAVNNEGPDQTPTQNNGTNVAAERSLGQELTANTETTPLQQYGYATEKTRLQLKSYIGHRAEEMYVYRSLPLGQDRRRNRYWQFVTSASRNDPGSGRIFFECKDGFWRLIDSEEAFDALLAALDTRGIRESHLHSMLTKIEMSFKETLRKNVSAEGLRSSQNIVKKEGSVGASSSECELENESPSSTVYCPGSDTSDPSKSFRIELGQNDRERNAAFRRYQDFQKWLWKECFNSSTLCAMKYGKKRCTELLSTCHVCYECYFYEEKHCPTCHKTFKIFHGSDRNFIEHMARCEKQKSDPRWKSHSSEPSLPTRIQTLKVQLSLVEVSIPSEALQPFWSEGYRKSWGGKLQSSLAAEDILQLLTLLESAVKRDYLSSNYETTSELLSASTPDYDVDASALSGSVKVLPWIPQTTAAVALRLMELDASISYMLHQKTESHKEKDAGDFIKIPSRYAVVKNMQETEPMDFQDAINYRQDGSWTQFGTGRSHARGRGYRGRGGGRGRGRGGRGQRGNFGLTRADFKEEKPKSGEKTARKPRRRGGRTRGRGRNRGRRTVRSRQRSESRVTIGRGARLRGFGGVGSSIKQQHIVEESPRESPPSSGGEEWDGVETGRAYAEEDDNSVGPYESDENGQASDENGQASGDEYDDQGTEYQGDYVSKGEDLMDDESEEDDADEDEEEDGDDGDEDMELDGQDADEIGEEDVDGSDGEEMGDEDGDGEGNEEDEDATSFSSEYSD